MVFTLPSVFDGDPFSADAVFNRVSEALRNLKAIADRARPAQIGASGGTTGYIQHAYDDLEYAITGGSVTVVYGGNNLGALSGTGTVDLTSYGLTVGQVYTVTTSGSGYVQWLSERLEESYVSPPDFTTAIAGNFATQCNQMIDGINDLVNHANAPNASFANLNQTHGSFKRDEDNLFAIARYFIRHSQDRIRAVFRHSARGAGNPKPRIIISAYTLAGADQGIVFRRTEGGSGQDSAWVEIVVNDKDSAGDGGHPTRAEDVYAVTSIGSGAIGSIAVGDVYELRVQMEGTGTEKEMFLDSRLGWVGEESSSSGSWTDPPGWDADDQNITQARMNIYSADYDYLHPGSGGATAPLYYDNPVQWEAGDAGSKRVMKHLSPYLVYLDDSDAGTPQIYTGIIKGDGRAHGLPKQSGSTPGIFNLQKAFPGSAVGLPYGSFYLVDDNKFAQELEFVDTVT